MTAAITTVRQEISGILENPTEWNTYAYVPMTVTANSVILQPDDPYVQSNNNSHLSVQPMFNFKITCIVPLLDNQGALDDIETLTFAVWAKLAQSNRVFNIGAITAPTVLGEAGGMLASEISIATVGSWT